MHLSGQLSDWSIHDLLQIMQVTKKTGSLDIEGERRGRVHFRDGRVTGAELAASEGTHVGSELEGVADILYVLSTVEQGSFSVGAADGPDAKGWTVEEVLVDLDALQSLESEVVDAGLIDAEAVKLTGVSEPVTINPEDWQMLIALVPSFSFNALEARFGRGTAVRTLHALHSLGMTEMASLQEGESDWLDRLAEGVASGTPAEAGTEATAEPVTGAVGDAIEIPDSEPEVVVDTAELVGDAVSGLKSARVPADLKGVSAPASTTLTDGVYDEIRRLRSKVGDR